MHPNLMIVFFTCPLVTCVLNGHLKTVTIPDAVLIQFVPFKMNTIVLETRRGV